MGVGSIISDIIDKPAYFIYGLGRSAMHSIVIILILLGISLVIFRKDKRMQTLATMFFGSAIVFHLVLDSMWEMPQVLFFPLLGNPFVFGDPISASAQYLLALSTEFTMSEVALAIISIAMFAFIYINEIESILAFSEMESIQLVEHKRDINNSP